MLTVYPDTPGFVKDYIHENVRILNQHDDKSWAFAVGFVNSSFTGIAEMGNGDILVLERAFDNITKPFYIGLRQLKIAGCDAGGVCESTSLLILDSQREHNLDNFEGLAKIDDRRYLMVSDNNENKTQRNLLSLIVLRYSRNARIFIFITN